MLTLVSGLKVKIETGDGEKVTEKTLDFRTVDRSVCTLTIGNTKVKVFLEALFTEISEEDAMEALRKWKGNES